jgi:hypothetical protein
VPWIPSPGASDLTDLSDVDVVTTAPTDGQALVYDDASGLWVPGSVSGGGSSPLTTKGDVYTHDGSTDARLAVGSDGQVLTADSAAANGIKWATPSGGGTATHVGAKVTRESSNQSVSANTDTAVEFDTESWDTDGFADLATNPSRLTVPTGLGGKYVIIGGVVVPAGGEVKASIRHVSGSTDTQIALNRSSAGVIGHTPAVEYEAASGDYFYLQVWRSSGFDVSGSVQTFLSIRKIG